MYKKLIILGSPEDYLKFKEQAEDSVFLALDYFTYRKLKNDGVKYFFSTAQENDIYMESINLLAQCWFRDQSGLDRFRIGNVSVGNTINRRLTSVYSQSLKLLLQIKKWSLSIQECWVPKEYISFFKEPLSVTNFSIHEYNSSIEHIDVHSPLRQTSTFQKYPPVHRYSWFARVLQLIFTPFLRKRPVLLFPDWTSIELGRMRKDTLTHYCKYLWKGYFLKQNKKYFKAAEELFPTQIPQNLLEIKHLKKALGTYEKFFDNDSLQLFKKTAIKTYDEARDSLIHSHAVYSELFDHYKPKLIIIPSETHYAYVTAAHLAESKGIKSSLMIDGYMTTLDSSLFLYKKNGKDFLFDHFYSFGKAHRDLLLDAKIPNSRITTIKPTFTENISSPENDKNIDFDFIILALYPHLQNTESRWDMSPQLIINVIKTLNASTSKKLKIGIKIKQLGATSYSENDIEIKRYQATLKENEISNVDLLVGSFSNYINKTHAIIGQVSTAILESYVCRTPFYIYEPFENGKSEKMLNSSKIFSSDRVYRSVNDLVAAISKEKYSNNIPFEYIYNGESFKDIEINI
jgi:hypothetical protein